MSKSKRDHHAREYVFVTGATGFIGHYVVAELLQRQECLALLLRPGLDRSRLRLAALLAPLGHDLDSAIDDGRVVLLEGDVNGRLPRAIGLTFKSVLHIAACTDFEPKADGDPWRTNVLGTRHLLDWAAQRGVPRLHLVSSAYRCGVRHDTVYESIDEPKPVHHNAYEHSKWQAEQDAAAWARQRGVVLTVYRPSIVVGHSTTGRTTSFGGFYIMARATQVLARSYSADDPRRYQTGIRLVGRDNEAQNLVTVDYVAAMIATAVHDRRHQGAVYHLTHPCPPTNGQIKSAVDRYFDVAGSGFVTPDVLADAPLSDVERLFHEGCRPLRAYLIDTPTFARGNTFFLELAAGVCCPRIDDALLVRLMRYACDTRWGRGTTNSKRHRRLVDASDKMLAVYFQRFLPYGVAQSQVARMTALSVTVKFVIADAEDGLWRCRFERGRLVHCERVSHKTHDPNREAFTYTTDRHVFWEAAAGRADPQRVFLDGVATVEGDVESALKMAVVLHRFNRELPCDPAMLARWQTVGSAEPTVLEGQLCRTA